MIFTISSLYDKIDNCHTNLIMSRSAERAALDFVKTVNATNKRYESEPLKQTNINEYELHALGTFDDETGVITPFDHYKNVALPLN